MNNKKKLFILLLFFFSISCSFDKKTGFWKGDEDEKNRILALEEAQNQILDTSIVYTSENIFSEETAIQKNITLNLPLKNTEWKNSGLNNQNLLNNISLPDIENIVLKKRIGKNKFGIFGTVSTPIILDNNIIISDNSGTIYSVNSIGKINWKRNIYKKLYKKVYKNLKFASHKDKLYVSDNVGFIYSISLFNGELLWIKNHGLPLKSNIKIYKNKMFLINQDNRTLCININDGSIIWDIRAIPSFIKSHESLSIAVSKDGYLIFVNSAGDLIKASGNNGQVLWSSNVSGTLLTSGTDFFKTSGIVIDNNNVFLSTKSSFFSYNIDNGVLNWEKNLNSSSLPIIDKENIFLVTDNGYFVILDKKNGEIISSSNILKVLKKKKKDTSVTGFIMGSGKIYSVTLNGYLIVTSATTGITESVKKIGETIMSPPIVNNETLFILTKSSKIYGFN